jgi:uncharacterized protein
MTTIVLLTISNIFMTFAWYGHLSGGASPSSNTVFKSPRIASVLTSSARSSLTIQEVITLTVFSVFSALYLDQQIKGNYILGFVLIGAPVFGIFKKW